MINKKKINKDVINYFYKQVQMVLKRHLPIIIK